MCAIAHPAGAVMFIGSRRRRNLLLKNLKFVAFFTQVSNGPFSLLASGSLVNTFSDSAFSLLASG